MTGRFVVNGKRYDNLTSAARAELNERSDLEMYNLKGDRVADVMLADYIIARDRAMIELANEEYIRLKEKIGEYDGDEWFDDFRPGVFFWDGVEQIFRRINDKFVKALN